MTPPPNAKIADVIIIGAGHNGLICAAYLAKAGLDVVIVERSDYVGGACITQALVPGCRFSTFAYGAHGPGAKICRDLHIPRDAFTIVPLDPVNVHPFPDGDCVIQYTDVDRTAENLAAIHPGDAERYADYLGMFERACGLFDEYFLTPPVSIDQLRRNTADPDLLESILTRSHWDILGDYFESDKIKCALARADDAGPPSAVGGLLAECVEACSKGAGVDERSGIPQGGMGAITQALADAARGFGVDIRVNAAVQRIVIEHGRAVGVQLGGGETLRADIIASNADPKRTLLTLIPDLADDIRQPTERITTRAGYMKFHALLNKAHRFAAVDSDDPKLANGVRIAPSLAYYENAWNDCQSGIPARRPVMSTQLPTAYIPDLAPPGKHIFGAWIRYAPRRPQNGDWSQLRQPVEDNIIRIMDEYAPGFADAVQWHRLYTPQDIETETGITDASIRHVDQTLNQMLDKRPVTGWAAYRTPIDGLYLCGSGVHPCGSVTGGPGHNAAHAILNDRKPR